ncbi:helix-turn-helix domain-containing protein [Mesorhizobium caraganae]|uniref:helix-turn-helix domain-containing protein n=1 Tax=Mesorhizobium caraganae TaxID=483206 RepID=UPI003ED02D33
MKLRGVFGLNVQRLRRERKLSQEQLSFVSGRTRAYISSVEAGRRNATLDTVEILAKALNVEPQELVSASPANKRAIRVTKPAASKSSD